MFVRIKWQWQIGYIAKARREIDTHVCTNIFHSRQHFSDSTFNLRTWGDCNAKWTIRNVRQFAHRPHRPLNEQRTNTPPTRRKARLSGSKGVNVSSTSLWLGWKGGREGYETVTRWVLFPNEQLKMTKHPRHPLIHHLGTLLLIISTHINPTSHSPSSNNQSS